MYVVLLKFSENKSRMNEFMDDHNAWLKSGFDDEVFLVAGSLQPGLGGAIITTNLSKSDLEARVNDDPFVAENIVSAEIIEITPARTDERLQFMIE